MTVTSELSAIIKIMVFRPVTSVFHQLPKGFRRCFGFFIFQSHTRSHHGFLSLNTNICWLFFPQAMRYLSQWPKSLCFFSRSWDAYESILPGQGLFPGLLMPLNPVFLCIEVEISKASLSSAPPDKATRKSFHASHTEEFFGDGATPCDPLWHPIVATKFFQNKLFKSWMQINPAASFSPLKRKITGRIWSIFSRRRRITTELWGNCRGQAT